MHTTGVWMVDAATGNQRMALFATQTKAAQHVGRHMTAIGNCLAGRTKLSGGFRWQRASLQDLFDHGVKPHSNDYVVLRS